jgi:hypothetical protein
MYRNIMIAILGITVVASAGCANGPLRRFFRGSACNACQPAIGHSLWKSNDGGCPNGMCGDAGDAVEGVAPGPAANQVIDPNAPAGSTLNQSTFDPFIGGQIVNPPAGNLLPGPRQNP